MEPGYRKFLVKPDFSCGLEWVTVNYRSVYGKITIDWKKEKDSYRVKISVPANSRARIELPGVTEEVGSGNYQYIVKAVSYTHLTLPTTSRV